MISSGVHAFRNYLLFRLWPINRIMRGRWQRPLEAVEGALLADATAIREAVAIPVLCTGGFQTASVIREALRDGACDAVTIARPLVANNDLVRLFAQGQDRAPRPCSYCNKCLFNVLESPLGCYDERRYGSREEMIDEIYSVFDPPPFVAAGTRIET
jgi:2,4-dienoyl-CoA reductase (NADPH2)